MTKWSDIYHKYSNLIGSDFIASPKALRIIQKETDKFVRLNREKVPLIIEIGTGIGTIADLITTRNQDVKYFAFERDEYCIQALKANIPADRFVLFADLHSLNIAIEKFNSNACFLIVDDFIDQHETELLVQSLKGKSLKLIIEGHRFRQRIFFTKCIIDLGVNIRAKFFGNSRDSVKGVFYLESVSNNGSIINAIMRIRSRIVFFRLIVQQNLYSRKILQWFGIRKRYILNYLPRLSKRS